MTWLPTARLVTFATVSLFSLIVMSISADYLALTGGTLFHNEFAALALATSLLTLLTVIPMFVVDRYRQGAIFSYIIVEIGWLSVLWVLWLASGADAASTDQQFFLGSSCDFGFLGDDGGLSRGCNEIKAITAFSFLTWLILMTYTGVLLFLAIRAQERGQRVWKMSVREDAIFYSEAKFGGSPAQVPTVPASLPQSYPPAPAPAPGSIQV